MRAYINKKYEYLYRIFRRYFMTDEELGKLVGVKTKESDLLRLLFNALALGIYVFFYLLIINIFYGLPKGSESLGTFGDFLGGTLNPILTFLTFLA